MLEQYGHGGDLLTAEGLYGRPQNGFLDYSSNMNPLGSPPALEKVLREAGPLLVRYPDPAVRELRDALAQAYGLPVESILVGNGAAELIDLAVRVIAPRKAAIARPSFSEYEEAALKAGAQIVDVPLREEDGFELQAEAAEAALREAELLFLGHPNNPTGRALDPDLIRGLLRRYPDRSVFIDEAFLDFYPNEEQLTLMREAAQHPRLMVIRSMTKFYAIPGLRLGFIVGHPEQIARLRAQQVPWSVNTLAQLVGTAVLREHEYARRTRLWLQAERPWLVGRLERLGLAVAPGQVNFVLVKLPFGSVKTLQREMGRRGILIRDASLFPGLNESWFRLAIRLREDNERMLVELEDALRALNVEMQATTFSQTDRAEIGLEFSATTDEQAHTANGPQAGAADQSQAAAETKSDLSGRMSAEEMNGDREALPASPIPARTIMVQGTSSDAGKSILTTALCRILKQDGWRVAPFKSQNMSLNSYVTPDGKEIGRAQGMQADACGIAATTDMNPILLKPKKDMVSQVVVHGKPLQDYDARSYREKYLPEAGRIVREALARLRGSCDVVVLEGAGSPAEINLKDRDIVNMRAASWADAPVILVADIDRGGVFASLVGTMEILNPDERARVKGFVINKFRGDVTLLKPGLDWLENRTGVPVLGVIPHLPNLGLEDEDSASLDAKQGAGPAVDTGFRSDGASAVLDIAVLRLPRLSNFTDFDPLPEEPDVRMRYITSPEQWGTPDAVILPGSKNTVEDLLYLRESGLEALLQQHVREGGAAVGICAGYQMMGARLLDPERCESDRTETEGLGWLPAETEFYADKRTERVQGTVNVALLGWSADVPQEAGLATGTCDVQVEGYEIHMGRTRFTGEVRQPFLIRDTRLAPQSGKAAAAVTGHASPDSPAGAGKSAGLDYKDASSGTRQQFDTNGLTGETDGRNSHGQATMASTGVLDAQGLFHADGAASGDGLVWGTYIHGILHNDVFRRAWLNRLRRSKGWEPLQEVQPFGLRREQAFDRLAEHVRSHLAMERIYEMIGITDRS